MIPTLFITLMLRVLPADTITKSKVSHQRGVLSLYLTDVFCVSLGLLRGKQQLLVVQLVLVQHRRKTKRGAVQAK